MPREVVITQGPNSLTAAAVRLTGRGDGKPKRPKKAAPWYTQAWNFYDTIGEYRYACNWVGNLLSRATLEVWKDGKKVTEGPAVDALDSFFGGSEGQREFLRQSGTHLTVPGDYYIVGEDMGDAPDKWSVVSATRINSTGGDSPVWKVGGKEIDDPLVIRIWRPHPNDQEKSDSPSRAVLPILSELLDLTKYVASQVASRLAGAGVFVVPNEMSFGSVRSQVQNGDATDGQNVNTGLNAFLMELYESFAAALETPEDPASRVPVLLAGPGDSLDKIRHITLSTELDKQTKSLRDEAIRRLALGMDMPPEILTGTGDMNHWSSWSMEEAAIKAHTEPLLQLITTAVTEKYLWPYLLDVDDSLDENSVRHYVIHADTSKIRLRPNRSKEALELYDRGILTMEAAARENGFDPDDLMDDDARKQWFIRKVAAGSTTPELVAWALQQIGLTVPAGSLVVAEGTEAPNTRSLTDHPTRDIPDSSQIDASEVAIYRALERAGAKLRSKYKAALVAGGESQPNASLYRYAQLTPDIVDDLLAGAWDICGELDISMSPAAMDAYVRKLMGTGRQFSSHDYRRFLATSLPAVA
jgi:hypothetical protein